MRDDSKLHLIGGLGVLLVAVLLGLIALHFGVDPLAALIAVSSMIGAATVEGTQWFDNKSGKRHEVSLHDWAWSAGPGIVAAVMIQIAVNRNVWPL